MAYIPSEKEFSSVINLGIDKRVKYFKNTVCDQEEIWLCYDEDGNLFLGYDEENHNCLFVWPSKKYAEWFFTETKFEKFGYNLNNLKAMEIRCFLEEYIKELTEEKAFILVFPTEQGGALFSPYDFKNMMEEELARYGDYD